MANYAPEECYETLLASAPRILAFDPRQDFTTWRAAARARLRELLGPLPERAALDVKIEFEQENKLYREIRFVFTSEQWVDVPCHLLIPRQGRAPFPLVICLQGHTTGMHISLGRARFAGDAQDIAGNRDFAIQAVRQGYAALAIEQRCFGERKDQRPAAVVHFERGCRHAAMTALLLGRTLIGDRAWDVSRAIDALAQFPEIDLSQIGCMGNSGGGTVAYYAACLDERITIAMPSCAVCTFAASIGKIDHCEDNYIPGILRYFEMGDLAGLIAPRPLILVAGREDGIFPIAGVQESYQTIQAIYAAAGAADRCRLVIGPKGHRFYADLAWPVYRELTNLSGR